MRLGGQGLGAGGFLGQRQPTDDHNDQRQDNFDRQPVLRDEIGGGSQIRSALRIRTANPFNLYCPNLQPAKNEPR